MAPCVGCPFDLNLNVKGVDTLVDAALKHVESEHNEKHTLVRIIRLQQQVNKWHVVSFQLQKL